MRLRYPGAPVLILASLLWAGTALPATAADFCISPTTLCLQDLRFEVTLTAKLAGGDVVPGKAKQLTADAGAFWFFSADNLEVAVKVLDATAVNGHFWVFYGGLSDLEFDLTIMDKTTGISHTYLNKQGRLASKYDFETFPSSPTAAARKAADLIADFTSKVQGLTVSFTDTSTGGPDRWCWIFDDSSGTECDSVEQNPQHPYKTPGTYHVHLLVSRTDGPSLTTSEIVKPVVVESEPPPPPACSYQFKPSQLSEPFPAAGQPNNTLTVIPTPSDCSWKVVSDRDFLTITSSSEGIGPGSISYDVAANPDHMTRKGTLTIAGTDVTFAVDQDALCTYEFIPPQPPDTFPATGGSGMVTVDAPTGCNWTVVVGSSDSDFLTITSPPLEHSGTGMGDIMYDVAANPDHASRKGSLVLTKLENNVADLTFPVSQLEAPCDMISPASEDNFPGAGGHGTVTVTEPRGCPDWTAESQAYFITIDDPTRPVSGTGSVSYTVTANPVAARRQGTLLIARQTFTVTQLGCAQIDSTAASFPKGGGTGSITVTAPPDCFWIAESNTRFLTLTSGFAGNGDGVVMYKVAPTDFSRQGTLSVAGETFTVDQEGSPLSEACIESNSGPETSTFGPPGGVSRLQVKAAATCTWTTGTDSTFLKLPGATSHSGDGVVPFCLAANRHAPRSGFLAVSESPAQVSAFPITQAAPDRGNPAAPCQSGDPAALCLRGRRFEVRASFGDLPTTRGFGQAVAVTSSTGYFWFFDSSNPELMVKVLDGSPLNGSFWVVSGALTNLPYVLTVTDTTTGKSVFFCNLDDSFQSFADTGSLTSN